MLNNIGIPGLLLIAVVVLVLFGKGKVSSLMGEVGRGITAFKKGVSEGTAEIEKEQTDALEAETRATEASLNPDQKEVVPGSDARNVTPPSDKS